jgi:hypothetical protein
MDIFNSSGWRSRTFALTYFSAKTSSRRINKMAIPKTNYSSNPTQWVRFSMLPRFCASSIFCVIQ